MVSTLFFSFAYLLSMPPQASVVDNKRSLFRWRGSGNFTQINPPYRRWSVGVKQPQLHCIFFISCFLVCKARSSFLFFITRKTSMRPMLTILFNDHWKQLCSCSFAEILEFASGGFCPMVICRVWFFRFAPPECWRTSLVPQSVRGWVCGEGVVLLSDAVFISIGELWGNDRTTWRNDEEVGSLQEGYVILFQI